MVTTLNQLQSKWSFWAQTTPGGFSFVGYIEARLVVTLYLFFSMSNSTTLQTSSDGCLFFVSSIQGMQCENHNPPYAKCKRLMRNTLWGCKLWYGDIVYTSWTKRRWKARWRHISSQQLNILWGSENRNTALDCHISALTQSMNRLSGTQNAGTMYVCRIMVSSYKQGDPLHSRC